MARPRKPKAEKFGARITVTFLEREYLELKRYCDGVVSMSLFLHDAGLERLSREKSRVRTGERAA